MARIILDNTPSWYVTYQHKLLGEPSVRTRNLIKWAFVMCVLRRAICAARAFQSPKREEAGGPYSWHAQARQAQLDNDIRKSRSSGEYHVLYTHAMIICLAAMLDVCVVWRRFMESVLT